MAKAIADRAHGGSGAGMTSITTGIAAFLAIFGGALLGLTGARLLPDHHLGSETRTAVSVSMAVVGTLSALVIGLLISTASTSFSARTHAIGNLAVDMVRLNRSLVRYGPEADAIRDSLRTYAQAKIGELGTGVGRDEMGMQTLAMLETISDRVVDLHPADDRQRHIQEQSLQLISSISDARWLLIENDKSAVPVPFLVLLIFWLAILFASFGLFAPRNATALAALFLCSVAVAGGIFMILELAAPTEGVIRPSLDPIRAAIGELAPS
jgi:ABC-type amino acid transport system permease subunit